MTNSSYDAEGLLILAWGIAEFDSLIISLRAMNDPIATATAEQASAELEGLTDLWIEDRAAQGVTGEDPVLDARAFLTAHVADLDHVITDYARRST